MYEITYATHTDTYRYISTVQIPIKFFYVTRRNLGIQFDEILFKFSGNLTCRFLLKTPNVVPTKIPSLKVCKRRNKKEKMRIKVKKHTLIYTRILNKISFSKIKPTYCIVQ